MRIYFLVANLLVKLHQAIHWRLDDTPKPHVLFCHNLRELFVEGQGDGPDETDRQLFAQLVLPYVAAQEASEAIFHHLFDVWLVNILLDKRRERRQESVGCLLPINLVYDVGVIQWVSLMKLVYDALR